MKKQLPWRLQQQGVLAAATRWRYMGEPGSVRSVVPSPSSPKILKRLETASRIKLGRTDRNTIFVFERDGAGTGYNSALPIALASHIKSVYPGDRASVLEDVLVLSRLNISQDVCIIIPNTSRHIYVANYIGDYLVNFGALDDCVFPHCKRCRRSAQCLTGGICHCVVGFGRFSKVSTADIFSPGDRYNQWTFAMSHHMPLRTFTHPGISDYDVWLRKTEDSCELEFTRST